MSHRRLPQLALRREAKIATLLGEKVGSRYEASGVLAADDGFYVIFDNIPHIAWINPELSTGADENRLIQVASGQTGSEDIAYDRNARRFFVLIEAVRCGPGEYRAKVFEYDVDFGFISAELLDFPLDRPNKGLEGLTCVHRDGSSYLLGLCEGNRCRGGADGRRPGGGRIQVFTRGAPRWERVDTIRLPSSLWFEDYSSLAVVRDRIAVVSQESSALWVGRLAAGGWDVLDDGEVYLFPRDEDGKLRYCTVEGVSWLPTDEIVVVSDKAKPGEHAKRCGASDQSIHVFALPSTDVPRS